MEEGGGQASLLNLITWLRIAAWVVLRGGSAHRLLLSAITSGPPLAAAWLDGTEFNCYPKCQPFQTHSISSLTFKEEEEKKINLDREFRQQGPQKGLPGSSGELFFSLK